MRYRHCEPAKQSGNKHCLFDRNGEICVLFFLLFCGKRIIFVALRENK